MQYIDVTYSSPKIKPKTSYKHIVVITLLVRMEALENEMRQVVPYICSAYAY
jgi:hypothetical protein